MFNFKILQCKSISNRKYKLLLICIEEAKKPALEIGWASSAAALDWGGPAFCPLQAFFHSISPHKSPVSPQITKTISEKNVKLDPLHYEMQRPGRLKNCRGFGLYVGAENSFANGD